MSEPPVSGQVLIGPVGSTDLSEYVDVGHTTANALVYPGADEAARDDTPLLPATGSTLIITTRLVGPDGLRLARLIYGRRLRQRHLLTPAQRRHRAHVMWRARCRARRRRRR